MQKANENALLDWLTQGTLISACKLIKLNTVCDRYQVRVWILSL